jgi:hypothetical protein
LASPPHHSAQPSPGRNARADRERQRRTVVDVMPLIDQTGRTEPEDQSAVRGTTQVFSRENPITASATHQTVPFALANLMFIQFTIERGQPHPQPAGRFSLIAVATAEHAADVHPLIARERGS